MKLFSPPFLAHALCVYGLSSVQFYTWVSVVGPSWRAHCLVNLQAEQSLLPALLGFPAHPLTHVKHMLELDMPEWIVFSLFGYYFIWDFSSLGARGEKL